MSDNSIIDNILNAIFKVIIPDKVILFGSRAKGTARVDSDYDILIIKSGIENGLKIESDIYMNLDINASVDIIVASPEIVEQYKDTIGCVIKPALSEGIVIYG